MVRVAIVVLLGVLARPASAHWSASRGRSLYTERYLICDEHPETRVHCAGPVRARGALLAALAGGDVDAAHDAAVDAVYFNVQAAVQPLRGLLGASDIGLRAEAAYALAHLGDAQSADAIAALVGTLETAGYGTLWEDTLAALAVIAPARASRYAIDFIDRARDYRISMPGGSDKLGALAYLRRDDAARALPVLERAARREERGYDHAYCELMAARVRLDDALHERIAKQLVGSYSGTWLAGCAESVLRAISDMPALIRHLGRDDAGTDFAATRIAYDRLLALAAEGRLADRELVRRALVERRGWPYVAEAPFATLYAALDAAVTGEADALYARSDRGDWLAAYWALALGLRGAADRVAPTIARGGGHARGLGTRVLEAFATRFPDDPRWTVLLHDRDAGEQALYRIARHAPRGTCEAVAAAASTVEGAEHAFLALTVLGDTCRPALARRFEDRRAPSEVRGAALELLGALGDRELAARIARAERDRVWRPAIERARRWLTPGAAP